MDARTPLSETSIRLPREGPGAWSGAAPRFFGRARIDNAGDLCQELALPATAKRHPAELILAAWRRWGRETPVHLYGDFAFLILDPARRTMFAARDPFGVMPLYFHISRDALTFSMSIRALLTAAGTQPQLDDAFVVASLSDAQFGHAERTWLAGVRKLPGGHRLHVDETNDRVDAFWTPEDVPDVRLRHDDDYVDAARSLVTTAVTDRLLVSGRVGVHLSGGLDSSAVAVLAARANRCAGRHRPVPFAWQPGPALSSPDAWEQAFVHDVCAAEGLDPVFETLTADDVTDVLALDPVVDAVTSTLFHERPTMRAAAERGVTRVLSGWGGDEGISAHANWVLPELLRRRRWRALYSFLRRSSLSPWRAIASEARSLLQWQSAERPRSYLDAHWARQPRECVLPPVPRGGVRSRLEWIWRTGGLAERMESWHEHGARHGIEYAYPLLDRRVVEFAIGVPLDQHRQRRQGRWLMRRLTRDLLPDAVRWHTDKGDPERTRHTRAVRRVGLEFAGRRFDSRQARPDRRAYIDMPALVADLQPAALARTDKISLLWRTFNFVGCR